MSSSSKQQYVRLFLEKRVADLKHQRIPPKTCTMQSTLETVVLKMAATHVHRIWIVDEHQHPIGLVSTTDLMNALKVLFFA
jgi:CBS-domain-containing membrane protein